MVQGSVRGGLSGSLARGFAVLALLGLVGGCVGGEAEVEPLPTTQPATVTPQPEPEPVEEVPEEPVAPVPPSGTPNEYDAEAAGEFFVRLYEYTLATGDARQWRERSHPECGFCATVLEGVDANRAEQRQLSGVEVTTGRPRFVAFDDVLRMFAVEVPYEEKPTDLVGLDGEVVKLNSGGEGYLLLDLGYQPSTGWQLRTGGHYDEPVQ